MQHSFEEKKIIPRYFSFKEVEKAFVNGSIPLQSFAEVLSDNFGKKKARKILRKNLEKKLKELQMPFDERQEHLQLISLLI